MQVKRASAWLVARRVPPKQRCGIGWTLGPPRSPSSRPEHKNSGLEHYRLLEERARQKVGVDGPLVEKIKYCNFFSGS